LMVVFKGSPRGTIARREILTLPPGLFYKVYLKVICVPNFTYNGFVTSQVHPQQHKQHDKQHHHGGGAACPSSGVDLMNPCRLSGGRPCECLLQGRRRSNLIDSIN
jgi:hypothetical protein